jgi:RHS repeat-associated protein
MQNTGIFKTHSNLTMTRGTDTLKYYAFGSAISEMQFKSDTGGSYRYGFNNQEKDEELGEYYAFEYRIHDARLGRFLSVDPLAIEYPFYSTYQFAGNTPIAATDIEGAEPLVKINEISQDATKLKLFVPTSKSTFKPPTIPTPSLTFAQAIATYSRPPLSGSYVSRSGLVLEEAITAEELFYQTSSKSLKAFGLLLTFMLTPFELNCPGLPQYQYNYNSFNTLNSSSSDPSPQEVTPIINPSEIEPKQPERYQVYETSRNVKTGKLLPYFGITKQNVLVGTGGRYSFNSIEGRNMAPQPIAENLKYDVAKGVEANLIRLNNPYYPLSVSYSPWIDNMNNSVDPFGKTSYRLTLGRLWLDLNIPNWKELYNRAQETSNETKSNDNVKTSVNMNYSQFTIKSSENTCPEPTP